MTDNIHGPLALANPPQFSPEYWTKVPRQTVIGKVTGVRESDVTITEGDVHPRGWKEFVVKLANGQPLKFRRKIHEVNQLVLPGSPCHIEVIGDQLVTGMYLPDVGSWVFRMSAQDLADYTKELAGHVYKQEQAARELMIATLTEVIFGALIDLSLIILDEDSAIDQVDEYREMAQHLALVALAALETGPEGTK